MQTTPLCLPNASRSADPYSSPTADSYGARAMTGPSKRCPKAEPYMAEMTRSAEPPATDRS